MRIVPLCGVELVLGCLRQLAALIYHKQYVCCEATVCVPSALAELDPSNRHIFCKLSSV